MISNLNFNIHPKKSESDEGYAGGLKSPPLLGTDHYHR